MRFPAPVAASLTLLPGKLRAKISPRDVLLVSSKTKVGCKFFKTSGVCGPRWCQLILRPGEHGGRARRGRHGRVLVTRLGIGARLEGEEAEEEAVGW